MKSAVLTFLMTFSGLAFETVPFLAIGTLLSSIIHVFVPDSMIRRLFPKNRFLSILVAIGIGCFLPICECGTVPLAHRLHQKGVPLPAVTAFVLAAPIVSPLTVISTIVAFRGGPYPLFLYRLGCGVAAALIVALCIDGILRRHPDQERFLRPGRKIRPLAPQGPRSGTRLSIRRRRPLRIRIGETLEHTMADFLDTARFLVAGITVASAIRVLLPATALPRLVHQPLTAAGIGLASAYVLSLCSSADAFVARALFVPDSYTAAICFLIAGPMIDVKNSILLARFVRPRYLVAFIVLIFAACLTMAIAVSPAFGAAQ